MFLLQHLSYLMKTYLEPLKKETFLSNTEINALFGNIQEIFGFQQQFLQTLENALETEAQFLNLDSPAQFKVRHLTSVLLTSRYRPASQSRRLGTTKLKTYEIGAFRNLIRRTQNLTLREQPHQTTEPASNI